VSGVVTKKKTALRSPSIKGLYAKKKEVRKKDKGRRQRNRYRESDRKTNHEGDMGNLKGLRKPRSTKKVVPALSGHGSKRKRRLVKVVQTIITLRRPCVAELWRAGENCSSNPGNVKNKKGISARFTRGGTDQKYLKCGGKAEHSPSEEKVGKGVQETKA